jgi:hypothetical protein
MKIPTNAAIANPKQIAFVLFDTLNMCVCSFYCITSRQHYHCPCCDCCALEAPGFVCNIWYVSSGHISNHYTIHTSTIYCTFKAIYLSVVCNQVTLIVGHSCIFPTVRAYIYIPAYNVTIAIVNQMTVLINDSK